MNNVTIRDLTAWIEEIKEAAKDDASFSVARFGPTAKAPFAIVAGWHKMYHKDFDFSDVFCVSKSQPEYVMCIKIVENTKASAYNNFESLNMPIDKNGEVDDTCIPLEWDDSAESAAIFFLMEWERIMNEHKEDA